MFTFTLTLITKDAWRKTLMITIDMSCISQNYFTSLTYYVLIQGFSTCISLLTFHFFESPHTWKVQIWFYDQSRTIYTMHFHLHYCLLNCPWYFVHLLLCKLYILLNIFEVYDIYHFMRWLLAVILWIMNHLTLCSNDHDL